MIDTIELNPVTGPVRGRIRPPGSKSITNRVLICAALADGDSTLRGALASEDTAVMIDSLRRLGLFIEQESAASELRVRGSQGEIPAKKAGLYIANSGTSMRFLTALVALGHGEFRLDGTPRMCERPIQDLLDGLSQLGVRAESELKTAARRSWFTRPVCPAEGPKSAVTSPANSSAACLWWRRMPRARLMCFWMVRSCRSHMSV